MVLQSQASNVHKLLMDNRLTIHCNVAKDRARSIEFIRASNSVRAYLLDPDPAVIDIALETGKRVGVRLFDPLGDYNGGRYKNFDNEYHTIPGRTPEMVFNWLANSEYSKYRGNKNVQFILGMNEPSNNNPEDLARGITWATDWGQICAANNFGALMGGFNITKSLRLIGNDNGTAYAPDVDNGIWDILMQVAHRYPEWLTIDIHVYSAFRAWYQFVGDPYNKVDMLNPPGYAKISWQRTSDGNYPAQWYVGRSAPLLIRKQEKGYTNAQFGIGEMPVDNMSDPPTARIIDAVANEFTRPGFEAQRIRGIRSLRTLFRYWNNLMAASYTNVQFCNDAFKDCTWMHQEYPHAQYLAYYAGNSNPEWVAYNVFHEEMRPLVNLIQSYIPEDTQETPIMTFRDALVRSTSVQGTNLRDAPNGNVVSKLTSEPIRVQVSEGTQFAGSYAWRILIIDGKELYAADSYIIISEIMTDPQPPEDIEGLIELAVRKWINEEFDNELYLHISADGSASHAVLRSTTFILQALLDIIKVELSKGSN